MRHASNGARLVAASGEMLPLRDVGLTAEVVGGIARTVVRQRFANRHAVPLELTYQFPLPVEGAISAYEVVAGRRTIVGRVERRDDARAEYDSARLTGRTASLVEEERPNLFTQHLGNIPASTDVTVQLTVDHPLTWLPSAGWEWRFPTVVAPRYLGAEGVVPDSNAVTVDVTTDPVSVGAAVRLNILDDVRGAATSPTHSISSNGNAVTVNGGAALDRDIVIRWSVPAPEPRCTLRVSAPSVDAAGLSNAYGLLTIVPPTVPVTAVSRDLVLLLDVSGSMMGRPLAHLKSVVGSLIDSLEDEDSLEMVAFSSSQVRYAAQPVRTSEAERRRARAWVESLAAGGGTELIPAIEEALRPVRAGAIRQVVVVTDGQIGFEAAAVRAIRDRLPARSRLHAVGIGSASNRAFLRPAARAGRGVEIAIDVAERTDYGTARILAATAGPVMTDVTIEGGALGDDSARVRDLLSAAPVVTALRLRTDGGTLVVRGQTADGPWEQEVTIQPLESRGSDVIRALWARAAIEDLELDLASGAKQKEIDTRIEAIALQHSISSRLTSWIAIAEEPAVDPRDPVRVERIPQMLPYGTSAEGLGLVSGGFVRQWSVGAPNLDDTACGLSIARPAPMAAAPGYRMRVLLGQERAAHEREARKLRDEEVEALEASRHERRSRLARIRHRLAQIRAALRKITRIADRPVPESGRSGQLPLSLPARAYQTPGRSSTTLEIVSTSAFEWHPSDTAAVGERTVSLLKEGTTRPGAVTPPMLARAELAIAPGDLREAGHVEIACEGGRVLIVELTFVG